MFFVLFIRSTVIYCTAINRTVLLNQTKLVTEVFFTCALVKLRPRIHIKNLLKQIPTKNKVTVAGRKIKLRCLFDNCTLGVSPASHMS